MLQKVSRKISQVTLHTISVIDESENVLLYFFTPMFKFSFIVLCLILNANVSFAEPVSLPRDGRLKIYVYHTQQFAQFDYLDENGVWNDSVYNQINTYLRSYNDNQIHPIDKRLIELADHLQDHFEVETVEVISGYRSPAFNKSLKESGHNVAEESYHTKGMALDIHLDDIRESDLRDYLKTLGLGGVGYYGNKLMVHMDFGPVREWSDGEFFENLSVGIFNKQLPLHITTDRFYYHKTDTVKLFIEKPPYALSPKNLFLEYFARGEWHRLTWQAGFKSVQKGIILDLKTQFYDGEPNFGKFRITFSDGKYWQNSNEFYVKRVIASPALSVAKSQ